MSDLKTPEFVLDTERTWRKIQKMYDEEDEK